VRSEPARLGAGNQQPARRHRACEVERHSIDLGARVRRLKSGSGFVSAVAGEALLNYVRYSPGRLSAVTTTSIA
jgi:hypothetical protein